LSLEEAVALAMKKLPRERTPGFFWTKSEARLTRSQLRRDTEVAYWELYGAYWNLHHQEQGLKLAYATWRKVRQRDVAGSERRTDLLLVRGQYEYFVRLADQKLRCLLAIDSTTGPLVPTDTPRLTRYEPDWKASLMLALARREELREARRQLAAIKAQVILERFASRAIRSMPFPAIEPLAELYERSQVVANPFVCGLFNPGKPKLVPASRAGLSRAHMVLQDSELKVIRGLGLFYRRLESTYQRLEANGAECARLEEQVRAQTAGYFAYQDSIDRVLEAQRSWLDARAQEVAAAVAYANTRCWFSWARGTIFEDRDRIARTPEDAPPESELPVLWRRVRPLMEVWALPDDDARESAASPLVPCDSELLFARS
jgi:outer membrane protein TolC